VSALADDIIRPMASKIAATPMPRTKRIPLCLGSGSGGSAVCAAEGLRGRLACGLGRRFIARV